VEARFAAHEPDGRYSARALLSDLLELMLSEHVTRDTEQEARFLVYKKQLAGPAIPLGQPADSTSR
jgi:hypothetical protein